MGRKGISITFYDSDEELQSLHVIEEKYNMRIDLLSLDNMDVFEKTMKENIEFSVCFKFYFISWRKRLLK